MNFQVSGLRVGSTCVEVVSLCYLAVCVSLSALKFALR